MRLYPIPGGGFSEQGLHIEGSLASQTGAQLGFDMGRHRHLRRLPFHARQRFAADQSAFFHLTFYRAPAWAVSFGVLPSLHETSSRAGRGRSGNALPAAFFRYPHTSTRSLDAAVRAGLALEPPCFTHIHPGFRAVVEFSDASQKGKHLRCCSRPTIDFSWNRRCYRNHICIIVSTELL
jgi:hypothetical protein